MEEEDRLRASWQDLENDEQQIDQLREEVERMEQDKARLSQEQDQCRDKLERGRKLLGNNCFANHLSVFFHFTTTRFPLPDLSCLSFPHQLAFTTGLGNMVG